QFMDVPESSLLPICLFGGFVLLGSIALLLNLGQTPALQAFAPLIYGLFAYAVLFFGIPLVRFFVVDKLNRRITADNDLKRVYANAVKQPSATLARKLEAAEEMRCNSVNRQPE